MRALAEEALEDAQEGEELPSLRDKHRPLVRIGAGELREGQSSAGTLSEVSKNIS